MEEILHLIPNFINFGILVGFLGYKLNQPFKNFVATRHSTIRTELGTVREQIKISQKQSADIDSKLKNFEGEVNQIRTQLAAEAKTTREKIVSNAKHQAQNIVQDAKTSSNTVLGEFQSGLVKEYGLRVINMAEKKVRSQVKQEHQSSIRRAFTTQMEMS